MGAVEEGVVRRFYEQMCNGRRNDLAAELFTADHVMFDPQVPSGPGPDGMAAVVDTYQRGVDGHWQIEEMLSAGDRVIVRWTGTGTHIGEVNGIPPTGRAIRVDAITIHHLRDGRICETREVWDTLGFLQQLGVIPGENAALIRTGYEAFARGDVKTVLALFDPEITWTTPDTVRFGGTYRGPQGVADFFTCLPQLYEDLQVLPASFVEQGDQVVVQGMHEGRTVAGIPFKVPFVHCWTLADRKATAFTEYFDTVRLNAALGVPAAIDLTSGLDIPSQGAATAAERAGT